MARSLTCSNSSVIVGLASGEISRWNVAYGEKQGVLNPGSGPMSSIAYSQDGTMMVTGHTSCVELWQL